jgi:hypothetical protein
MKEQWFGDHLGNFVVEAYGIMHRIVWALSRNLKLGDIAHVVACILELIFEMLVEAFLNLLSLFLASACSLLSNNSASNAKAVCGDGDTKPNWWRRL